MEGINQEDIQPGKIDILEQHGGEGDVATGSGLEDNQIQRTFERFNELNEQVNKIDLEKIGNIHQEVSYLRQIIEFQNSKIELQNSKIDKLSSLISEFIENKNHDSIISSIQHIHDHNLHHDQQVSQDTLTTSVQLDSNMDPALHQVAVAAVAAATERDKPKKKRKLSENNNNGIIGSLTNGNNASITNGAAGSNQRNSSDYESKKPKIEVNFLHNPTTVKEIHDEFTKGFKGQPPLCDLDAKFGKHEWRGDSRSKESKRYQRRKKLCDAIERGMIKYGKPADEIIRYIEEFRGDKSLTWVMNGNLPHDLMN